MEKSVKEVEDRLKMLVPRGLSDRGFDRCCQLIDRLAVESVLPDKSPEPLRAKEAQSNSWQIMTIAASVALFIGIGGGWILGRHHPFTISSSEEFVQVEGAQQGYEVLDSETWLAATDAPTAYISENGEVREVFREIAVTKELVKHRQSGNVITLETTAHHLIDSAKSEF
jgi:hypothetical protein